MPDDTIVSIAMATYNGARYLKEQLDSFATQTRLPDELVVSDDGSTDETLRILTSFRDEAPFRVRILKNIVPMGVRDNFSRAIEACRGEYVLLSDQDDVWLGKKLETMLASTARWPQAHVTICDALLATHDLSDQMGTKFEYVRRVQLNPGASHVMGCCMMLSQPFVRLATPIPRVPGNHDNWLFVLGTLLDVVELLEEPLQFSRRHSANESAHPLATPMRAPYLRLFRERMGGDSRQVYEDRRLLSAAACDRLREHSEWVIELVGRVRAAEAVEAAETRLKTAIRRERLLGRPRVGRMPSILRMLVDGEYSEFAGWRSAISDMVAPRSRVRMD